jgi:hypothetical protein
MKNNYEIKEGKYSYKLTPVAMEPTWFSRFVQGAAEFIAWLLGR